MVEDPLLSYISLGVLFGLLLFGALFCIGRDRYQQLNVVPFFYDLNMFV